MTSRSHDEERDYGAMPDTEQAAVTGRHAAHGPTSGVAEPAEHQATNLFGQWLGQQSQRLARVADTTSLERWPETDAAAAVASDLPFSEFQLFAVVDASQPDRVVHYGMDVGDHAVTFRRNPSSGRIEVGHWSSMQSAYDRLDKFTPYADLALIMFDSVPVMALTPLVNGWPGSTAITDQSAGQVGGADRPAIEQSDDWHDA